MRQIKRISHAVTGALVTTIAIKYIHIDPILAPITVAGSIVPDFDILIPMIKHRTITHSIVFLGLTAGLFSMFNVSFAILWALNVMSHIVLDSMTKRGVPLFYPYSKKNYGFKLIKTGGFVDYIYAFVAVYILIKIYLK